ncbi:MinD/ParA family protein [Acetivibrio cellulolyticus]|uniref:MinD/ParA family protein n=1 Tax=Acetivibrio cellulolyticus TaxID=35830 RepID=UPI0001E2C239|nr:MinD/ParA family protein [Acetivibrio cellulolyticus]
MMDQAERLRQIIDNLKLRQAVSQANLLNNMRKKTAKVITVTSGKGGVGKTNITVNLAIALSEMGKRVTILDADFGLANIDVLLGIIPKYTLVDVIYDNKNIFEVLSEGPKNIRFVSGGSGVEELVKLDKVQLEKFLGNISLLDKLSDVILIDTGAGLSDNVMSFVMAADEVLLVTTPEPTSITDAYALIKMVSNRDKDKKIKVIVNRAESANEANDILNKLSIVTDKFLELKLEPLGYILQDEMVIKAVKMQQPFALSFPKCQASRHIKDISSKILDVKNDKSGMENTGIKSFVSRLVNLLNT